MAIYVGTLILIMMLIVIIVSGRFTIITFYKIFKDIDSCREDIIRESIKHITILILTIVMYYSYYFIYLY